MEGKHTLLAPYTRATPTEGGCVAPQRQPHPHPPAYNSQPDASLRPRPRVQQQPPHARQDGSTAEPQSLQALSGTHGSLPGSRYGPKTLCSRPEDNDQDRQCGKADLPPQTGSQQTVPPSAPPGSDNH